MKDDHPIKLDNLTTYQTKLLDKIWSLKSREEFEDWMGSLPIKVKRDAITLVMLLEYEIIDQSLNEVAYFHDAIKVLKKIML